MSSRALLGLIIVTTTGVGCAGQRNFRPTEHATARSLSGEPAAEYELKSTTGEDLGEVKVWSGGTRAEEGADATVLHVGFEIENEGKVPLRVNPQTVTLESVEMLGETVREMRPARADGDQSVAPGAIGRLHVYFVLRRIDPTDVESFYARWTVSSGAFVRSERTPFVPIRTAHYHYYPRYYGPYYDPFYPYYYYRPVALPHRPGRP